MGVSCTTLETGNLECNERTFKTAERCKLRALQKPVEITKIYCGHGGRYAKDGTVGNYQEIVETKMNSGNRFRDGYRYKKECDGISDLFL